MDKPPADDCGHCPWRDVLAQVVRETEAVREELTKALAKTKKGS